jgi:hypothetical protein
MWFRVQKVNAGTEVDPTNNQLASSSGHAGSSSSSVSGWFSRSFTNTEMSATATATATNRMSVDHFNSRDALAGINLRDAMQCLLKQKEDDLHEGQGEHDPVKFVVPDDTFLQQPKHIFALKVTVVGARGLGIKDTVSESSYYLFEFPRYIAFSILHILLEKWLCLVRKFT